jgi:hypothetical protein
MKNLPEYKDFIFEENILEDLNESVYVSPQEKERKLRESEDKLKITIRDIREKIKKDPVNTEVHKAALDIALAKQTVFDLIKKWKDVKDRHAKMKKPPNKK